ncbi:MAG: hypothetical protein U5L06_07280 [Rhodovibrio sp.]|nr:hypothetical protein [Rhodovibrio sp.]
MSPTARSAPLRARAIARAMLYGLIDFALPDRRGDGRLGGIVRGFSGFGSAMLLVPSLSALYGPQVAIPMLGVMELAVGGQLLPRAIRSAEPRTVGYLSRGALVGFRWARCCWCWCPRSRCAGRSRS